MKSLDILIRVDGENKIGMGHVYRALNLANALKKFKHKIVFLTKNSITMKMISSYGYKCKLLPKNSIKEKKTLQQLKANIAIIDKLKEKTSNIKILQKNCRNVFAIDYVGNNKNIIQYGVNILYPISGITNKNSFSGLKYAILDKTFTKMKKIPIKKKVTSILVLQGGSDRDCFIPKIIDELNYLKEDIKITVILGPSFKCWKKLKKAIKKSKKHLKILYNVTNMSYVMTKHDMAITAGGVTLLELCCLGIPSIFVCGGELENETTTLMQRKGFGINLGYHTYLSETRLALVTKQLLEDYHKRKKMSRIGRKIIDGKGADRLAQIISNLEINK